MKESLVNSFSFLLLALLTASGCTSGPPHKPCRKARATATLSDNGDVPVGKYAAADILIQLGKRATSACKNSHTCTREIPVDGDSVDIVLTDVDLVFHDEIGRVSGVSIPSSQVKVGSAFVDITCVE